MKARRIIKRNTSCFVHQLQNGILYTCFSYLKQKITENDNWFNARIWIAEEDFPIYKSLSMDKICMVKKGSVMAILKDTLYINVMFGNDYKFNEIKSGQTVKANFCRYKAIDFTKTF